MGDPSSDGTSGIDELNIVRESGLESRQKKVIMATAQDEDIGVSIQDRGGVFGNDLVNFVAIQNSAFYEFDKFGAGLGDNSKVAGVGRNEAMKFLTSK